MKSVLLLLLLLVLVTPSFAQHVSREADVRGALEERVSRIERQMEAVGMVSADLAAALLRQTITQTWGDNEWENSSRTIFTYSGEVLVEARTEDWDGDSWEPSSRIVYSYSGSQLASITTESFQGGSWSGEFRSLFSYSGDRLSQTISQSFDGNAWVNQERTTLTETGGQFSGGTTETWTGTEWEPADRFTIQEEGNDVVLEFQEWSGSEWVNVDRTVYPDFTIESLYAFFEEFATEGEEAMSFSLLLRIPDSIQQEWDGSEWVNVSRQVSERSSQGLPVTVTYEEWVEGEWSGETRLAASYDGEGRITRVEFQQFVGTWMGFLIETFTYDSEGLLAEVLTQLDFGFGLQNSSRVLFDFTGEGTGIADEGVPVRFVLEALYPNPFNPQTTVSYRLDAPSHARIRVFDALGRHVATLADGMHAAGDYELTFEAADRPSGTYLVRLETASGVQTRTVTLLR